MVYCVGRKESVIDRSIVWNIILLSRCPSFEDWSLALVWMMHSFFLFTAVEGRAFACDDDVIEFVQ